MGLKADKAEVKHGVSKRKWLLLDLIVALESFGKTSQEWKTLEQSRSDTGPQALTLLQYLRVCLLPFI